MRCRIQFHSLPRDGTARWRKSCLEKPLPLPRITLIVALMALISPAFAIDDMQDQETIAELLETPASPRGEQQKEVSQRPWAVLPEFGYGPETGAKGGLKFQDRDILGLGAALDVHGSYAMNQQESFTMVIATPHLLEDQAVGFFRLHYDHDPQLNFFSIGNNNVTHEPPALHQSSQDETSTEAIAHAEGSLIVGWRPWERLAVNRTHHRATGCRHPTKRAASHMP